MTPRFLAKWIHSAFYSILEHWGKGRIGEENRKLRSLESEIRCPSEDVQLAIDYISLEFRAESWIEDLILEPPAYR